MKIGLRGKWSDEMNREIRREGIIEGIQRVRRITKEDSRHDLPSSAPMLLAAVISWATYNVGILHVRMSCRRLRTWSFWIGLFASRRGPKFKTSSWQEVAQCFKCFAGTLSGCGKDAEVLFHLNFKLHCGRTEFKHLSSIITFMSCAKSRDCVTASAVWGATPIYFSRLGNKGEPC